jgi:hypothetical protein
MQRVFVDTSAWFAFANRSDPDHGRVAPVLKEFERRLVTSTFVFDETVTLCRYRYGHVIATRMGEALLASSVVDLVRVTESDERLAWRLFRERRDKSYSFTDCTSFVLMRRMSLQTVVSLDDDFRQEGFETLPAAAGVAKK